MFVLDTCAFLTQKHPDGECITVPGIKAEIVNKQSKQYYNNLISTKLKVLKAKGKSYELVIEKSKNTGDYNVLSDVDIDIIALGHETKGTIISDDFAIQNVAMELNINFLSCSGKTIAEKRLWKYKCTACNNVENIKRKDCLICGSTEIRRVKIK